jgi:ubiquinone/menaquinone biosynthesis C-methylase UbiE
MMNYVVQSPSVASMSPKPILDMNYAFAQTAMLLAAVRLHIFTHLANDYLTATTLAALLKTQAEPVARLLEGLRILGLVEQEGDIYRLTPIAHCFLVEGRPSYLGGDTLAMQDYIPAWLQLDQTLLSGQPYRDLGDPATAEAFFAPRVRDLFPMMHPIAKRLVHALNLQDQSIPLQILDVGAGSAAWSAAFAQHYPQALVTAVDLPAVAEQGHQQVADLGLSDRYHWLEADIFDVSLPSAAYDLIVVAHICRFMGEDRSRTLFRKLFQSLRPGGTLVVADILLLDDHSGPAFAVTLNLSMLVNTRHGHIFTFQDFSSWLNNSGFREVHCLDIAGPSPVIVALKGEQKL